MKRVRTQPDRSDGRDAPLDPLAARAMEVLIEALVAHYRRQLAGEQEATDERL